MMLLHYIRITDLKKMFVIMRENFSAENSSFKLFGAHEVHVNEHIANKDLISQGL
jgi:hypothetical protein